MLNNFLICILSGNPMQDREMKAPGREACQKLGTWLGFLRVKSSICAVLYNVVFFCLSSRDSLTLQESIILFPFWSSNWGSGKSRILSSWRGAPITLVPLFETSADHGFLPWNGPGLACKPAATVLRAYHLCDGEFHVSFWLEYGVTRYLAEWYF